MKLSKIVFSFVIALIGIGFYFSSCNTGKPDKKTYTAEDISAVLEAVNTLSDSTYRLVLPEFRDGKIVGSKVYGSLAVTQVRRIASSRELEYEENGNLQAIFQSCSGGGAGSHTPSQSAGQDIGKRIENILSHIDKSEYLLMY